jgi:hypothetical protein
LSSVAGITYASWTISQIVTLDQEIVTSLIFSVTEILAIENDKFDSTVLHIAFKSQSLLNQQVTKPTLIPIEGSEKAIRGGWMRANQNSSPELNLYHEIDSSPLSSNSAKTV